MHRTRRSLLGVAVMTAAVAAAGCSSDDDAVCVSNEVGEVCAESDGSITFSGSGLLPSSDVSIDNPEVGPAAYVVDADGKIGSEGLGYLSLFADTEFTFTVSAVDADGEPLQGVIVIRS
jgi:hypothetical protein